MCKAPGQAGAFVWVKKFIKKQKIKIIAFHYLL